MPIGRWVPYAELGQDLLLARHADAGDIALLHTYRGARRDRDLRKRAKLQDNLARHSGGRVARVHELLADNGDLIAAVEAAGQPLSTMALPLPCDQVAVIGRDLARAVALLHDSGRVHGALHHGSVLDGGDACSAALLDLGLAIPIGEIPTSIRHVSCTSLAPENFDGEPVGPRTDVWGIGALCFTLATGQAWHPRSAELLSDLDPQLAAAIRRCLITTPAERYGTASEIAAALEIIAPPPRLSELFEISLEALLVEPVVETPVEVFEVVDAVDVVEEPSSEPEWVVEEHEWLDEATAFGEHASWFIKDGEVLDEDRLVSLYGYKPPLGRVARFSMWVAITSATFASIIGLALIGVEVYGS